MADKTDQLESPAETVEANRAGDAPRRAPGHRGADARDTLAELTERAQLISQEAGNKVAMAVKDVISAAAGIAGFSIDSARDLVQFLVRRGQMSQEEADRLVKQAEEAHDRRSPSEKAMPTMSRMAADRAAARLEAAKAAAAPAPVRAEPSPPAEPAPAPVPPAVIETAPAPLSPPAKAARRSPAKATRPAPAKPSAGTKAAPASKRPAAKHVDTKHPDTKPAARPAKSAAKRPAARSGSHAATPAKKGKKR